MVSNLESEKLNTTHHSAAPETPRHATLEPEQACSSNPTAQRNTVAFKQHSTDDRPSSSVLSTTCGVLGQVVEVEDRGGVQGVAVTSGESFENVCANVTPEPLVEGCANTTPASTPTSALRAPSIPSMRTVSRSASPEEDRLSSRMKSLKLRSHDCELIPLSGA